MEADDLEWEDNPSNIPFVYHMIAGSTAGLVEHVCMFPVDTLKTHVQCERCGSVSPLQTWRCATGIVGREGIFRLWRGVSAMFVGCIPAHAAYFSIFEGMKIFLGADHADHTPVASAACGALAAMSHDGIMTPFDTVKQRMQLGHYKGLTHCLRSIIHQEGFRALYKSFPTTLAMNIPYGCIMVAVNESMRKYLTPGSNNHSIQTLMLSGSVAGGVASVLTTPLDVIKTRLQVQSLQSCPMVQTHTPVAATGSFISEVVGGVSSMVSGSVSPSAGAATTVEKRYLSTRTIPIEIPSRGPFQILKELLAQEGYLGLFRGAVPRMMVHIPSVAVSWTTYDTVKKFITSDL